MTTEQAKCPFSTRKRYLMPKGWEARFVAVDVQDGERVARFEYVVREGKRRVAVADVELAERAWHLPTVLKAAA